MACILTSPNHANGGCIFADPSEIVTPYIPSCPVVFSNPRNAAGGCIFADPRTATIAAALGGGFLHQEEEEILAVIIAAARVLH